MEQDEGDAWHDLVEIRQKVVKYRTLSKDQIVQLEKEEREDEKQKEREARAKERTERRARHALTLPPRLREAQYTPAQVKLDTQWMHLPLGIAGVGRAHCCRLGLASCAWYWPPDQCLDILVFLEVTCRDAGGQLVL